MPRTSPRRVYLKGDIEGATAYVTIISEAARAWGKHRKTIENAILRGRLKARYIAPDNEKGAGLWLIDVQSLRELWGSEASETVATDAAEAAGDLPAAADQAPPRGDIVMPVPLEPHELPARLQGYHCQRCGSDLLRITREGPRMAYRVVCRECGEVVGFDPSIVEMPRTDV